MNKILLWGGAGAAALAWLLWPKSSSAAPNQPKKPPGPSPWGPGHWPPAPFTASVNSNVGGTLIVRAGPSTTSARVGSNANGTQVTVVKTGLSASDGSPGEWWQITSPGGSGFSRAVDQTGYQNFVVATPATAGVWPYALTPGAHPYAALSARRDWETAVRMGAHPAHVEALRRRYASMMQGGG